jgi:hypothetical protein
MNKNNCFPLLSLLCISLFYHCDNQSPKNSDTSQTTEVDTIINDRKENTGDKSLNFICDYLGEKPPKEEPVKFIPDIFSAGSFEISTTGNEIQFTRSGNIYLMSKTDSGWGEPYVAPFSGTGVDGESTFLPDGNEIYFMSNRPLANAKSLINTWVSEKINGDWQAPICLKLPSFDKTIHAVTVAKSGNIYFSGLYKIEFNNEEYRIIEKLKPDIIGSHPFIALDESYLIFDRNSDLYIIYSKTDGTWTQPIKLNNKINTPSQEGSAFVTPDGKFMFFSRKGDLYWVDAGFIEKLRPG